jgi:site-specific recombinase XerD
MDVREATHEFQQAKLHLSRFTRSGYKQRLAVFASWCEQQGLTLETITVRHVRAFIEDVRKRMGKQGSPVRSTTTRTYAQVIKEFLLWCAKEEEFEEFVSPRLATRVEVPRAERPIIETFTPEQLAALFQAADLQPFAVRDKALLAVLIDTGARVGEICDLTLDCVWLDADDSYIKVTGKGRKEREIALGRTARIALRRYITRYRKPKHAGCSHVFLARTGEPLTVSGLQQLIVRLGEDAHIKGVRCSPHTFRHTFACQYLLGGGDIYKLSRLMGHTSVKVTERYLGAIKSKQARQGGHSVLNHLKDTTK